MPRDGTIYLEPAVDPKPDPYSLDTFIAWLETMPGDRQYNFMGAGAPCLISQYVEALGCPEEYNEIHWSKTRLATNITVFGKIASDGRPTFGAALERAKAARSSTRADIDALLEDARL